jgi:hypothetical protein
MKGSREGVRDRASIVLCVKSSEFVLRREMIFVKQSAEPIRTTP